MEHVRAFDPQLWIDPNGKLWVFWSQEIRNQRNITSERGNLCGVYGPCSSGKTYCK